MRPSPLVTFASCLYVGRVLKQANRFKEAERAFDLARRLNPGEWKSFLRLNPDFLSQIGHHYRGLAELEYTAGSASKASFYAQKAIELGMNNDPSTVRMFFQFLFASKRYKKAMETAEELVGKNSPSYQDLWAVCFPTTFPLPSKTFMQKRLSFFKKLSRRHSSFIWHRLWAAQLLFCLGEDQKCREWIRFLEIPLKKRGGWLLFLMGYFHLQLGNWKQAISCFRKVKPQGDLSAWRIRGHIAEAYLGLGDPRQALKQFDAALYQSLNDKEKGNFLAWRGELNLWLNRHQKAKQDLQKSIRLSSDYGRGWMGALYLKLGQPSKAIPHLNKQIQRNPVEMESKCLRAEAYRLSGKIKPALKDLKECSKWGPWALFNHCLIQKNSTEIKRNFKRLKLEYPELIRYLAEDFTERDPDPPQIIDISRRALNLFGAYRRAEVYPMNILIGLRKNERNNPLPILRSQIASGKYQVN